MTGPLKNVVVIGGSYVGLVRITKEDKGPAELHTDNSYQAAVKELATLLPITHRVIHPLCHNQENN